jgi:hypothetical protein
MRDPEGDVSSDSPRKKAAGNRGLFDFRMFAKD